jgi:plasmid replication initiation protein
MEDKLNEVRQHNIITTARYEMSAIEMDIVFCLLASIEQSKIKYVIDIKELEKVTKRAWNYSQLQDATYKLNQRVYQYEDNRGYIQFSLLQSAEYIRGTGTIELMISEKAQPYLLDLKERFTSYKLQSALSLTSKYAKRIYQLASQWKSSGKVKYTIEELKHMLSLKDPKGKKTEQYKQAGQFRQFVLEPAKEQINAHTDLKIEYELHKIGRSFHSITFYIQSQKPKRKPLNFKNDEKAKRVLEIARELGINRNDLLQEIAKDESTQKMLRKYANDIKLGNYEDIRNKAAYFIKMMENHKKDQNGTD